MTVALRLIVFLTAMTILAGCGQTGPLRLPESEIRSEQPEAVPGASEATP